MVLNGSRDTEDQREAWNRFYSDHRRPWRGIPVYDFPFPEGSRVLEAGCGGGKTAKALIDSGYSVVGIDFSEEAVSGCASELGIKTLCADICDLPFPDGEFDGISLVHVTEHLRPGDRISAASEMIRVLRPGGKVFLRTFSEGDQRAAKGARVSEDTVIRGNGIAYTYADPDGMRDMFACFREERLEVEIKRTRYGAERHRIEAVFIKP